MDDSFLAAYKKAREAKANNGVSEIPTPGKATVASTSHDNQTQESETTLASSEPIFSKVPDLPTVANDKSAGDEHTTASTPSFLRSEASDDTPDEPKAIKPKKVKKEKQPSVGFKLPKFFQLTGRKAPIGLLTGGVAVLLLLIIGNVWVRNQRAISAKSTSGIPSAQVLAAKQTLANQYLEQVKKLMSLETDDNTTVATITDVEKLRAQNAFFAVAKNGDVLIITARKAIILDPKKNVIVDTAPVNVKPTSIEGLQTEATDSASPSESASPTPTETATVAPTATATVKPTPTVQPSPSPSESPSPTTEAQ